MPCDSSPLIFLFPRYQGYCFELSRTARYLPPSCGYNVQQTANYHLSTILSEVQIANLPDKGNCRPAPPMASYLYGRAARYKPHRKGWIGFPERLFALPIDIYFISSYEDSGLIGCISAY